MGGGLIIYLLVGLICFCVIFFDIVEALEFYHVFKNPKGENFRILSYVFREIIIRPLSNILYDDFWHS